MIIGNRPLPILHVEGKNDMHVIGELMKAHGIALDSKNGPVVIQPHDSCQALLKSFSASVKSAIGLGCSVGFVFDIDRPEDNRFEQVCARLKDFGAHIGKSDLTDDGIVEDADGIKIGIWFMPSPAAKSGKLEDFLREMIRQDDAVRHLSDAFVDEVGRKVSENDRFRDVDREKAEMYAWLSVQPVPGLPYGAAINARILSASAPLAAKFVSWMRRVFDL